MAAEDGSILVIIRVWVGHVIIDISGGTEETIFFNLDLLLYSEHSLFIEK